MFISPADLVSHRSSHIPALPATVPRGTIPTASLIPILRGPHPRGQSCWLPAPVSPACASISLKLFKHNFTSNTLETCYTFISSMPPYRSKFCILLTEVKPWPQVSPNLLVSPSCTPLGSSLKNTALLFSRLNCSPYRPILGINMAMT